MELFRMFPDNASAERWFEEQRWPDGIRCPTCGSRRYAPTTHPTMPYRCRERICRGYFSVRKGTVMQSSKLGLQQWVIAVYMAATSLKGVSSMKLHRELGITQKAAWHLIQRLREVFGSAGRVRLDGTVEADEICLGGKERNQHASDKLRAGRGPVGKTAVVGAKQRAGAVRAQPVEAVTAAALGGFASASVQEGSTVCTDGSGSCGSLQDYTRASVNHGAGEYGRDDARTNGIESFRSLLKRGYYGTCHKMSAKRLHRYANEFAGRHNSRALGTVARMTVLARDMAGQRLRYRDLIAGTPAPRPARRIEPAPAGVSRRRGTSRPYHGAGGRKPAC